MSKRFIGLQKKKAAQLNRRIFLLSCRKNQLLPNHIVHNVRQIYSLELEDHPFKNSVHKILSRFRSSILNIEIKICVWKISDLQDQINLLQNSLQENLNPQLFTVLIHM